MTTLLELRKYARDFTRQHDRNLTDFLMDNFIRESYALVTNYVEWPWLKVDQPIIFDPDGLGLTATRLRKVKSVYLHGGAEGRNELLTFVAYETARASYGPSGVPIWWSLIGSTGASDSGQMRIRLWPVVIGDGATASSEWYAVGNAQPDTWPVSDTSPAADVPGLPQPLIEVVKQLACAEAMTSIQDQRVADQKRSRALEAMASFAEEGLRQNDSLFAVGDGGIHIDIDLVSVNQSGLAPVPQYAPFGVGFRR